MTLLMVCIFFSQGFAEEQTRKDPKVLVLIIASDNTKAYIELQKIWRSYMNSDPEHFEVYFIRGNPELSQPYLIEGNDLFVKTEEGYQPGIVNKTILSMEALRPRLKEFDFVLRTNLSSFYVFPELIKFVMKLPKERSYSGVSMYLPADRRPKFGTIYFVSGAGFLLSSDLVEMLLDGKEEISKLSAELPDDVLIGFFFQQRKIPHIPADRADIFSLEQWITKKDKIPSDSFHFRAKSHGNQRSPEESFEEEISVNRELLKHFYPNHKQQD